MAGIVFAVGEHGIAPTSTVRGFEAPDATVLLLCWPRQRRPLIRGVDHDEIEAAFPGWRVAAVESSALELAKPLELILRPDEHWYRLRRR